MFVRAAIVGQLGMKLLHLSLDVACRKPSDLGHTLLFFDGENNSPRSRFAIICANVGHHDVLFLRCDFHGFCCVLRTL